MKTKLVKETIERTLVDGVEQEKTIAIEKKLVDKDGNQVGSINVNQWGANISAPNINIENLVNYLEIYFEDYEN